MRKESVSIYFPNSGRVMVIPCTPAEALVAKGSSDPHQLKPYPPRKGACVHVGVPTTQPSCKNKNVTTWKCELYGVCAPKALINPPPGAVLCRTCPDFEPAPEPGWARLAKNVVTAEAKWILAGRPTRTQEQVNELLSICKACPHFKASPTGATYCGQCGCPVHGSVERPSRNKLALGTEACPIGLWGATPGEG